MNAHNLAVCLTPNFFHTKQNSKHLELQTEAMEMFIENVRYKWLWHCSKELFNYTRHIVYLGIICVDTSTLFYTLLYRIYSYLWSVIICGFLRFKVTYFASIQNINFHTCLKHSQYKFGRRMHLQICCS